ncbi:MAG TPA: hypothetical protein H9671_09100 [Firmicutes bacterium]|nr:hypothetical protein [Bacillota bacterium]
MRKLYPRIFCAGLVCLSLSIVVGCQAIERPEQQEFSSVLPDPGASMETSTDSAASDPIRYEEPLEFSDPEREQTAREAALSFLTALQKQDTARLAEYTQCTDASLLDDLKTVYISQLRFEQDAMYPSYTSFRVKLTVSESASDRIPVGESEWELRIGDMGDITAFVPWGTDLFGERQNITWLDDPNTAVVRDRFVYMARSFVTDYTGLQGISQAELEAKTPDASLTHVCIHLLMGKYGLYPEAYTLPLAEISQFMEQTFGVQGLENTPEAWKDYLAEGTEDQIQSCAHGYSTPVYHAVSSDVGGEKHVVTLYFYADSAYLNPSCTIQVSFDLSGEMPRILSAEVIEEFGAETLFENP